MFLSILMGCLLVISIAYAKTRPTLLTIRYSNPLSSENVIYKREVPLALAKPKAVSQHSVRATRQISEEALRQYLQSKNSSLVGLTELLLASPYYSTIIGICTIEEYSCSVNPYGSNNLWGLMSNGHLKSYPTLGDGLDAIETFLAQAEGNGRTTIESFRGWYCYEAETQDHVCWNWEKTVIETKTKLENL